ncbi:hypothetical protein PG997_014631 [Apiospora hydei]|uniref:Uncharacterized protein n=1 Tax=Apiospora hydei TaxID=1337664 RepID=A0ABR1UUC7_9PEZI
MFLVYRIFIRPWDLSPELPTQFVSAFILSGLFPVPPPFGKEPYVDINALSRKHVLRGVVNEDHDGVPEAERAWNYPHVMNCLNVLRESVMCNANDTPLYIGRLHKNIHENSPRAGTGTIKMCRDWTKLLEWSRARSACHKPVEWTKPGFSEIDRYKTCPDGSRPWENVEDGSD